MVRKLPHGVRKPEIPCPGNAGLLMAATMTASGMGVSFRVDLGVVHISAVGCAAGVVGWSAQVEHDPGLHVGWPFSTSSTQ